VRVGISLLTLSPADSGGSEVYARGLVRALAAEGSHEYAVFVPTRSQDAADGLPAVAVRELPVARRGPPRIPALALAALGSRSLRARLRTLDLLHYALTVPLPRAPVPTAVTLHDLQHRDLPSFFGRGRRAFRRLAYDRAAREAAAVIVPTAFVRARALDLLGLDPARVHIVPLAVDRALFRPGEEQREPFLLYPARPWPHKNHARLLAAFTLLRREHPELRLVLTGVGLERLGPLPEGVERRGAVSPDELASLYRRAACLVFPSLYEGFGLPPLEAMACGCPVAAANTAAIPEVCGDAAVLFDPNDPAAIAAGVLEAVGRASELHERGLARAARFTWSAAARSHDAAYESALSGARAGTPTTT
jgi:glycosyltransferase involved in cell wall biosynthesis